MKYYLSLCGDDKFGGQYNPHPIPSAATAKCDNRFITDPGIDCCISAVSYWLANFNVPANRAECYTTDHVKYTTEHPASYNPQTSSREVKIPNFHSEDHTST